MIRHLSRALRLMVMLSLCSVGVVSVMAGVVAAQQQQDVSREVLGVIRGTVMLDGMGLANQQVVLYVLRQSDEETRSFATSDRSGAFRFERLKTDSSFAYVVATQREGVFYNSPRLIFAAPERVKDVTLKVARTTTSDAAISLLREQSMLEFKPGKITVTTVLVARNAGRRAFIGFEQVGLGRRQIIKIPLPIGYKNFQLVQGGTNADMELVDWGGSYTRPMPPGDLSLAFRYDLMASGNEFSFSRNVAYETGQLDLLVPLPLVKEPNNPNREIPDPAFRVTSSTLTDQGSLNVQGRQVRRFSARGLQKGSSVSLLLAGLAPAGFWSQHADIAYGVIIIIILAGMLVPLASAKKRKQRRRAGGVKGGRPGAARLAKAPAAPRRNGSETGAHHAQVASRQAPTGMHQLGERKEALFERLISLEEARQCGSLIDPDYQLQRQELRRELKDILHAMPRQS